MRELTEEESTEKENDTDDERENVIERRKDNGSEKENEDVRIRNLVSNRLPQLESSK